MNGYADFLKAHLPPVALDTSASGLGRLISSLAPALDAANAEAAELLNEAAALAANELLPAWEVSYGIEADVYIPLPSRITLLLARIRARGGLSRQYFIDLAATLGYTITIGEFVPFMAGWGLCGATLYVGGVVNVWNVSTSQNPGWRTFEVGVSRAGDCLAANISTLLETLFNELKPAHTFVFFTYV
jgi:uncharacterized protein YmfQ (DUF2313 family)